MYFEAIAIAAELRDYPGGPAALARSIMPTIEGMRILRWPADRLDTLGGYLTYHNITLFTYFLGLFAALQGAKVIRHLEEEQTMDFILSTGVSRARLASCRSLAYLIYQIIISVGLGLGTAVALAASNEPDTAGSMVTMLAGGICIFPFFGLGLLLSQFVRSSRTAAGVASIVVTAVYILTNIGDKYAWLTWIRFFSPFHYANLTRPVIPGFGANYWSWFAMIAVGAMMIWSSILLLNRRDIHSTIELVELDRRVTSRKVRPEYVPRSLIGDHLWRQRYGVLAWTLATAAFMGVFVAMLGNIVDVWEQFDFLEQFSAAGFGNSPERQYLAMVYEILPPFIAGFIVAQSAKWTSDLRQGRVQFMLSTPMSWTGLIVRRVTATLIGTLVISVGALATAIVGTLAQGVDPAMAAVGRVLVMNFAFALVFASLCALLVAVLHGRNATQVLSIYIGAAWLMVFMAPYLDWPSWILRLSIFDALGHPFIDWPESSNVIAIALVALAGFVAAVRIAEDTSKSM